MHGDNCWVSVLVVCWSCFHFRLYSRCSQLLCAALSLCSFYCFMCWWTILLTFEVRCNLNCRTDLLHFRDVEVSRPLLPFFAIPSVHPPVCLSVCPRHAGTLWTNKHRITGSSMWASKITLVFWYQQWLGGDVPFHLKFALKVTHPLWNAPTLTNTCL